MDRIPALDRILAAATSELGGFLLALLSHPVFNMVVAAVIAGVVLLVRAPRRDRDDARAARIDAVVARYRPEHLVLAIGAMVVLVALAVENVLRGYVLDLVDVVEWWQYATPVFTALLVVLAALGLIMFRRRAPEAPVRSSVRRTWTTFGSRSARILAAVVAALLTATTIGAGLASSADDRGRYIYLAVPVPNTSIHSLQFWFYGWSFGVPVLVCTGLLVTAVWAVLRSNAARPFLRPETTSEESAARGAVATGTALLAAAGMLVALAAAWRFIAGSGGPSQLGVGDDPTLYDATWRFAEFAVIAGWLAPIAEIAGFMLLFVVAAGASRLVRRSGSAVPAAVAPDHSGDAVVRSASLEAEPAR